MAAPPPPQPYTAEQNTLPLPYPATLNNPNSNPNPNPNPIPSSSTSSSNNEVSPGILITVLILAIAVILSALLYLLLRFLRRRNHHHHHHVTSPILHLSSTSTPDKQTHKQKNPLIESLPLFPFAAISGGKCGGDCAICLSKFEPNDLLRLLPICCHAFHSPCIDAWLTSTPSPSCPLCRSPLTLPHSLSSATSASSSSRSFRVELGNVSRRNTNSGEIPRSYSIGGSFDYVLDDVLSEVPTGSFCLPPEFKEETNVEDDHQAAALAAEVGTRGGGGWLKDYLSNSFSSSSRTPSFRGSGRWLFTGGSRRSTAAEGGGNRESELDLEASQLSEEIGELFRWFSGV